MQPEGNPGVCSHPLSQPHSLPRAPGAGKGCCPQQGEQPPPLLLRSAPQITVKTSALTRVSFRQTPLIQAWQDIWDVLATGSEMCTQQHPTATVLFPIQPSHAEREVLETRENNTGAGEPGGKRRGKPALTPGGCHQQLLQRDGCTSFPSCTGSSTRHSSTASLLSILHAIKHLVSLPLLLFHPSPSQTPQRDKTGPLQERICNRNQRIKGPWNGLGRKGP